MFAALLLALVLPLSAANGPQPSRGRALSRAEYDALIALLRPGFNPRSYASLGYAAHSLYGLQPDGRACKIELELQAAALAAPGAFDPQGDVVITAHLHGTDEAGRRELVDSVSIQPRGVDRRRRERFVAVAVGPAFFTVERLGRFTNDHLTLSLSTPGKVAAVEVKKVLGSLTTTDFACRFSADPDAHYDAWRR